jgi:hypothetical protein
MMIIGAHNIPDDDDDCAADHNDDYCDGDRRDNPKSYNMKTGRLVWVLGTKLLPLGRIAHTD